MSSTRSKHPKGHYYTVGDRLQVTAQFAGHKFRIGDIVEVIGVENHYEKNEPYMICKKVSGGGHWWMTENEVKVVREVRYEDRKYTIGGKFRIVHNQYGHGFSIGTEVVVVSMNESTNAEYMNCKPINEEGRSWWVAEWEVVEIGSEATETPKPNRHREKVKYPVPAFNEPNK